MAKTLYVGNIPWTTSEEELHKIFAQYSDVVACRIITEKATGRSKGFGFIEINEENTEQILEQVNGLEFEGRKLVVNEARPR